MSEGERRFLPTEAGFAPLMDAEVGATPSSSEDSESDSDTEDDAEPDEGDSPDNGCADGFTGAGRILVTRSFDVSLASDDEASDEDDEDEDTEAIRRLRFLLRFLGTACLAGAMISERSGWSRRIYRDKSHKLEYEDRDG